MTTKLLLDTDIGTDIDDAVCLAYLLAQPACELLGITTVTGEADRRAMLASAVCKAAGVDLPIYPGAETPLLVRQEQQHAKQAAALSRWPHERNFPRGEAIEFLRRSIRRHPGEIVLLSVGPLTNIALLFKTDPEVAGLLKGLVMMAGNFSPPGSPRHTREWNAFGDPHATAIVYGVQTASHRSVGFDITSQVTMEAEEVRRAFQREPRLHPVLDFAEVWFNEYPTLTFHDPLAAATIFDETLCRFALGQVTVELADQALSGTTYWTPQRDGRHEVAVDVDRQRFFDHFLGVFG